MFQFGSILIRTFSEFVSNWEPLGQQMVNSTAVRSYQQVLDVS